MYKKLLLSVVFLLILVLRPQHNSLALNQYDEFFLVETTNQSTFLREQAEEKFNVRAVIPKNQKLVVLEEKVDIKNEQWLHVNYNGLRGWIKKTGNNSLKIKNQHLVDTSEETVIRAGYQKTSKQIGKVKKGQVVIPIDVFIGNNGEHWVRVNNGKTTGWVQLINMELFNNEKNYLNKKLYTNSDTQVRRGASHNERGIYTIEKGTLVTIKCYYIAKDGSGIWYYIKNEDGNGWIQESNTRNQTDISIYLFAKEKSKILRSAEKNSRVTTTLTNSEQVKAITKFISVENEIWYKVFLENGKSGWLHEDSISTKRLKLAYLTIDDGPTKFTSKLLDILNTYQSKATFFMINGNINTHPNNVRRMVKEGHAIGSHGVTHDRNKFYRSPSSAVNEMMITRRTLLSVTGVNTNLMRVPYGSVPYMKQSYRDAEAKQKFIMWDWNVDSLDWKFNNSSYVDYTISQVKNFEKSGIAPIILIHDRKATVDSLSQLLAGMGKLGYTFVPLSEGIKPHQFRMSK
ncbi:MAG: hypothetical protein K0S34_1089 [Bacillales bacterium]|jgi:peptidoglycan/xylan/chitin deacetylase (PgdA/CDA1 family)|nr:hypothetical protein [Bacillales bacterium]